MSKYIFFTTSLLFQYTDAKGNVTSYDYDPAGNLLTVKSGNDTLAAYTYDSSMMCVSEKVGDSLTKYGYDCLYRLASMTVRDAADTKTYKKETYAYAGSDISTPTTTTITLSEGTGSSLKTAIEDSTVNDCGWITEKYDYSKGLNGTKPIYKYEYDYLGNPVKVEANTAGNNTTDGPYAAATYEYDYAGRVTRETDSLGGVKEYTYDQLGRKTAEKDKNGNTSTFTYDAYNRLTLSSAPLEGSSYMKQRYTYDANGNVIKEETLNSAVGASESWAVTNYTYDADNNLTRAESIDTDSKKYYTTYGYDANGNTTRVTSANGKNATDYVYDKYNRVTKMTDPMGYVETYTYDIAGNMLSKTDRNGNKIQYTYDPANRLTKEYSGNTVRAEYTYDLAGNKIQETNSNITVKSTYNQQNKLSKVNITKPGENNINYDILYGYDARGNVNYRAVWKNNTGNRLDNNYIRQYYYTYDNNNNMTAVKSNNTSSATVYASYTYDANGNVLLEKFNNGVSTGYKYNKANLPVYIGTGNNKGQDQTCYRMEYYLDGNLKKNVSGLIGHVEMTLEYTYDGLGRLKTESNKMGSLSDLVTYTYDDAGNRSKVTAAGSRNNYTTEYIYDKNNRLVREIKTTSGKTIADVTRYTYDKNGNTLVKKQGTQYKDMYTINYRGAFGIYLDTEDMSYSCEKNTYDVFNRLVSTTDETGNKSTYTYYPSNLRLSKQVTDGSNTTYTGFMWDGSQIAAEFDEDFNITNHYLFGRGQRRISGTDITTNKQTYYIYNAHGDVEALAGAGGVVTKTYRYDAFGNEENETAGDTNPFRYCGEYYDTETGNIYLRARYYDPSIGSFITEDPARDGTNWYSYCGGNPVNFIDKNGLEQIVVSGGDYSNDVIHRGYDYNFIDASI